MYEVGDTWPLTLNVYTSAGVLTNATTVTLVITLPDGTTTTPSITNPPASTGVYIYDYVFTQSGRHHAYWQTTNPATGQQDDADAAATNAGMIVGLAEAKAWLRVNTADTTFDDEKLRSVIGAVTSAIEHRVGAVVRRSRTVYLRPGWTYDRVPLPYSPVISLTSAALVRDLSALTITNWYADGNVLRTSDRSPLPLEPFTLTYVVGQADLPDSIRIGALEVVKRVWRSQRGNDDDFLPFLIPNMVAEVFGGEEQLLGFA